MPTALICGAGKIGRGFLGQLLYRSGFRLFFFDASKSVVTLLNQEKKYRVDIAGRPEATEYIPLEAAFSPHDLNGLGKIVASADLLVSSVGAPHIDGLVQMLTPLLEQRDPQKELNWLICENALNPAQRIRGLLLESARGEFLEFVTHNLGLIETQILRSGMLPPPEVLEREPLALYMHNWWTLPADADAFVGQPPAIEGLELKHHFGNELLRKVYTFNGLNGPIAYVGWANGYRLLHEAARAKELESFYVQILQESGFGLIREFAFDEHQHAEFQKLAWEKYRDPAVHDLLERHAADSARKLGPTERLVGPACLCEKHGRRARAYAVAIAAAIAYDGPQDAGTETVQECLKKTGVRGVLTSICKLSPDDALSALVEKAFQDKAFLFPR